MRVNVLNGSPDLKYISAEAAYYFCERLLPKKVFNEVNLEIKFVNDDSACYDEESVKNPRLFYIEICKWLGMYNKLKAIAHECVHLKQHATNELRYSSESDVSIWRKKRYGPRSNYWKLPWEIEAFGMEEGLVLTFCEDRFYTNRPWYKKRYKI